MRRASRRARPASTCRASSAASRASTRTAAPGRSRRRTRSGARAPASARSSASAKAPACEGSLDRPIAIGLLQRFAIDAYLEAGGRSSWPVSRGAGRVAVVGSGRRGSPARGAAPARGRGHDLRGAGAGRWALRLRHRPLAARPGDDRPRGCRDRAAGAEIRRGTRVGPDMPAATLMAKHAVFLASAWDGAVAGDPRRGSRRRLRRARGAGAGGDRRGRSSGVGAAGRRHRRRQHGDGRGGRRGPARRPRRSPSSTGAARRRRRPPRTRTSWRARSAFGFAGSPPRSRSPDPTSACRAPCST